LLLAVLWVSVGNLLFTLRVRAQDEAHEPAGFDPGAVQAAVSAAPESGSSGAETPETDCAKRWGCWELLHTVKGTVLGTRGSVSYVAKAGKDSLAGGFVATYRTEHYATHENLAVHFVGSGSFGGGSAGNEGGLALGLDFGYRANVSERSGPFLRAGMNGMLLGNQSLYLAMFEPLQARVGYQFLDPGLLVEAGLTQGLIPIGTYRPGDNGRRSLARATELGGYAALHIATVRIDVAFMHLFTDDGSLGDDLDLVRGALCDYKLKLTICVDTLIMRGRAVFPHSAERMTTSLYSGMTLGFSP
jgi:hypothetical protein